MLDFVILALATWRLAHLLVKEDGPFAMFARLRKLVGIEAITTITASGPQTGTLTTNSLAEGLTCVWCVSVWCSLFFVGGALLPVVGPFVLFGARLLAVSTLAIVVHELVTYLREH